MHVLRRLFFLVLAISAAASAAAQSNLTFVSSSGNDGNNCSRGMPCATWAGALTKTNVGGEIDALDAGNFGPVTLTKSITLDGRNVGAIAIPTATLITVNSGVYGIVVIRNMGLNGFASSPGIGSYAGISVNSAAKVVIDHVTVDNIGVGIDFVHGVPFQITGTVLTNTGAAIRTASSAKGDIEGVSIRKTGWGIYAFGQIQISKSSVEGAYYQGIASHTGTKLAVDDCIIADNAIGIYVQDGTVYLSNSVLSGNVTAVSITAGTAYSFGNNRLVNNGSAGSSLTPASEM